MIKNLWIGLLAFSLMMGSCQRILAQSTTTTLMPCMWCGSGCVPFANDMGCTDSMPPAGKACVTENNSCVIKDSTSPTPTIASFPTPTPVARIFCQSDASCPAGNTCFQPSMPPCPAGMGCTDMMPARYCVPMTAPSQYPTPTPTYAVAVAGDTNSDGKVDLVDFSIWKEGYLLEGGSMQGDFNRDLQVDLVDFSIWKIAYLAK